MTYVVFLRGINVAGRIINMADLRVCFEKAGFGDVKTILQSRNLIFKSNSSEPTLKKEVETVLSKAFNYPAKAQVYSFDHVKNLADSYPFDASENQFQHYVIFMENNLASELALEAVGLDKKIDEVELGQKVLYWRARKGLTIKSPFSKYLTKTKYKDFNTVRNINTLKRIVG